jgi:tetratricopeptide (TPR) repeat protein
MSKPMVITLPFALLLLDYWPLGRLRWRKQSISEDSLQCKSLVTCTKTLPLWYLLIEKVPLFIIASALGVITFMAQEKIGSTFLLNNVPFIYRLDNALTSYLRYVSKIFYPIHLSFFYPYTKTLPIYVSAILLACISTLVILYVRQQPWLIVGWLWFLGILVPVIGFIPSGAQAMADRYTYLPSIGIFIMVTWEAATVLSRWKYKNILLGLLSFTILTCLLIGTHMQVKHWQNHFALYKHSLEVTKDNYKMHYYYGYLLHHNGQPEEAIKHYDETLRINPQHFECLNSKGLALVGLGKFDEAIASFTTALKIKPDYLESINNLGRVLKETQKTDLAITVWKKGLKFNPDFPDFHYNLGLMMAQQSKFDQAIEYFNEALRLKPNWPMAYYELAGIYHKFGKFDMVVEYCTEALRFKPDFVEARINLARTLHRLDRIQQAIEQYHQILKLEPNRIDALNHIARILATHKDTEPKNRDYAIECAERACRLTGYKQVYLLDTLAIAYAATGRFPEAIEVAEKATQLAETTGDGKTTMEIQKRLQLYKAGQPYRELP